MSNETPTPAKNGLPIDMQAVFEKFADAAAYHGFIVQHDEDEFMSERSVNGFLYSFDMHEDRRIWVHSLFDGDQDTTERFVSIDAFRKNPFSIDLVSDYKRAEFYRGTIDLEDLDFFEKLLNSIFPLPVRFECQNNTTPAPAPVDPVAVVKNEQGNEIRELLTKTLRDTGLIWTKHPSLNNWTLETKKPMPRRTYAYPYMYGWVEDKCWMNNGRLFETGGPKPYDKETDSDATSFGNFETLEEAMIAVETHFNLQFYI